MLRAQFFSTYKCTFPHAFFALLICPQGVNIEADHCFTVNKKNSKLLKMVKTIDNNMGECMSEGYEYEVILCVNVSVVTLYSN